MADINIQQKVLNPEGTYDNLYPRTKASNVIMEDGTSAQNNIVEAMPIGGIIMWSGSIETIPATLALCDGTNGTPDLRNRFIMGAGLTYAPSDTGGLDAVTLTTTQIPSHQHAVGTLVLTSNGNHSHSVSGTALTSGSHTHTVSAGSANGLGYFAGAPSNSSSWSNVTTPPAGDHTHTVSGTTSTTGDHVHTLSGSTANIGGGLSHENKPPYFALAYIMKL